MCRGGFKLGGGGGSYICHYENGGRLLRRLNDGVMPSFFSTNNVWPK